jgi:hypothetical protein
VPSGTEFIAFLHETQWGFIKFNANGPPDTRMIRIDKNVKAPERAELGDHDESQWPHWLNGRPSDPWKEQFAVPMARNDAGGELYVLVAFVCVKRRLVYCDGLLRATRRTCEPISAGLWSTSFFMLSGGTNTTCRSG